MHFDANVTNSMLDASSNNFSPYFIIFLHTHTEIRSSTYTTHAVSSAKQICEFTNSTRSPIPIANTMRLSVTAAFFLSIAVCSAAKSIVRFKRRINACSCTAPTELVKFSHHVSNFCLVTRRGVVMSDISLISWITDPRTSIGTRSRTFLEEKLETPDLSQRKSQH
jgi:hypothetical protein